MRPETTRARQGPQTSPSALDGIAARLNRRQVADALLDLSPEHRDVLVHVVFKKRSLTQTASDLDICDEVARTRLFYAMHTLRLLLEEQALKK
jgi:RNA polymerase sigma-70 factor (ECF subfamily)